MRMERSPATDPEATGGKDIPDGRHVIGEPFNPWHKVCGFYPPDVVGRNTELKLTDGQKRLYERGVRWAGTNGTFWYGYETIAEALGKSVRQVKDDMAVLEAKGLIKHTRRRRQSNIYSFLWHPIFEVQPTALQEDVLKVQDSPLEVHDSVKNGPLKVQPTARESCHSLNLVKEESSSEGADVPPKVEPSKANDDETPPLKEKTEDPPAEAVVATPRASAGAGNHGDAHEDRARLVETSREQLRLARASGLRGYVSEAEVKAPDCAITEKILGAFRDHADFTTWLEGTVSSGLAHKAKDPHRPWGLYLADAKNHTQDLALQREKDEKRRIDSETRAPTRSSRRRRATALMDHSHGAGGGH